METLVHNNPKKRRTFVEHCSKGWVLGNSFEHYCVWKMWMKTTRALHISATVFRKHKYISNPAVTPANHVLAVARNLADLLTTNVPNYFTNNSLTQIERLGPILKPEVLVPRGRADGNLKHLTGGLNFSTKTTIALPLPGTQPPNFPIFSPWRLLAVQDTSKLFCPPKHPISPPRVPPSLTPQVRVANPPLPRVATRPNPNTPCQRRVDSTTILS